MCKCKKESANLKTFPLVQPQWAHFSNATHVAEVILCSIIVLLTWPDICEHAGNYRQHILDVCSANIIFAQLNLIFLFVPTILHGFCARIRIPKSTILVLVFFIQCFFFIFVMVISILIEY